VAYAEIADQHPVCVAMLMAASPVPLWAQGPVPADVAAVRQTYTAEQIDAIIKGGDV
jgi:hypothetical protein